MENALASYVRGQIALSLIIGTSAGFGLWLLAVIGLLPHGQQYALLFGAWVAVTEVIPYLGPWLGAIPPLIYALVVHPLSALWVALLFLGIHQIEGHVVVPKVMGSALRLHPLLVIFGLGAGTELYGLPGALTRAAAARRRPRDVGVLLRPDPARAVGTGRARRGRAGGARRAPVNVFWPRAAWRAASGRASRSSRRTSRSPPVRWSRSSARTGPASRRCSRSSPGRSSRPQGTVERPERIGWVPQRAAHYGRLTALENLRLFAALERVPPERADELAP